MKNLLMCLLLFTGACSSEALTDAARGVTDELISSGIFDSSDYVAEAGYEELDLEGYEEKELPISEEAATVFDSIKEYSKQLREERRAICSRDQSIKDEIKAELDQIKDDEDMVNEDKHEAAMSILDSYKEDLEADKQVYEACLAENSEEISIYDDELNSIRESCLTDDFKRHKRKSSLGLKHKRKKMKKRPPTREQLEALEESLLSQQCFNTIAGIEDVDEEGSDDDESVEEAGAEETGTEEAGAEEEGVEE